MRFRCADKLTSCAVTRGAFVAAVFLRRTNDNAQRFVRISPARRCGFYVAHDRRGFARHERPPKKTTEYGKYTHVRR